MATTFGVTDNGFVVKPLSTILGSLNNRFTAAFGSTFDTSPESPDGQVIGIVADEIATCWDQAQAAFNSYRPGAMEGVGLDNICELTHVKRYVNRPTKVTVVLTGTSGTVVPAGSQVGTTDGSVKLYLESDVKIPGDGTAISLTAGQIYIAPGTVTKIITPKGGWTGVNNREEGITGLDYEQDPALRARRDRTTVSSGSSTVEAIYSALSSLDLTYVRIRDNDTGATIGTQPTGTVWVVVDGGTQNDIARRIYDKKPGGVPTYGNISVAVKDSKGYEHTIKFSRTIRANIWVTGTFKRLPGSNLSSNDVATALREAAMNYINSLSPGEPVVWSFLFNPLVASTPGIQIDTLLIGGSAGNMGTKTLNLDIDRRAQALAANVTFTETPP
ncbi:TPA: baseplate J/gp47 family protein [Escherichia coli]|nr:baseplate J/gp47 family protein [Escherichia coli]